MSINIGDDIAHLTFKDAQANEKTIADYKGKKLIIFIYPKDDTPGCTKESIAFSEHDKKFQDMNCHVIGLSKDDAASHQKFIDKYNLTIPLVSDEDGKFIESVGAWVEKNNYGKKYMGIDRSTYLIDENSKLLHVWRRVRVDGHVDKVLQHLESLS